MKKLILLNATLLAALFSIKFSHENLYAYIRAFKGNQDIASKEPVESILPVKKIEEEINIATEEEEEQGSSPPEARALINSSPEKVYPLQEPLIIEEQTQKDLALEKEQTPPQATVEIKRKSDLNDSILDEIVIKKEIVSPLSIAEISFQKSTRSTQESAPNPPEKGPSSIPYPKRILLSHTEGYGEHKKTFRTNYSLAEIVFAPDASPGNILPMFDFRGYRFDNSKYAISTGVAFRYLPGKNNTFCSIFGINVFYDYAPDTPGYHQQMGAGVEILGKRLDFRANFFAPFGDRDDCGTCCDRNFVNGWLSSGFNAEVGYLVYQTKSFFLYTGIGPYYVTACKCKERQRGIAFRVFPQYKDFVGLNLKYTYDPLFHSIFQAEILISVPFYQIGKIKKTSCGITSQQIYQRIERR